MPNRTISCRSDRQFEFDPAATALIVIDMQKDFFNDEGETMREIVPRVAQLSAWARGIGCTLIHTREGYLPDLSDVSDYRRSLDYVGRPGPMGRFLIRGEAGHDFLDDLKPQDGETVIDKAGFSAFHDTGLHRQLSIAGIDRLILCGVTTQCCVHSTLRDAVDLGYWCLTIADCCAATEPGLHDAALRLIEGEGHLFGWVCDAADAIGCLQQED